MTVDELIRKLRDWNGDAHVYLTGDSPVLWVQDPSPIALMNHEDAR